MTAAAYKAQNELGFEGDSFLKEAFKEMIRFNGIRTIIETGSYLGSTTKQLSSMVEKVYTIEINREYFEITRAKCAEENVFPYFGNSSELLPGMLEFAKDKGPIICWLDAHWGPYNPLLDELKAIKESELKPCIIVHDFKVPDHPELGFDSYAGQDYEWSWIEESINNIYGKDGYKYYYNSQAEGAKRGVIFIEPK